MTAFVLLCVSLTFATSCLKRAPDVVPATLTSLDARTGDEIWRVEAPVATVSAIAPIGGIVLVFGYDACPTSEGILAAVDAADGHVVWSVDARGGDCRDEESIAATAGVAIVCTDRGVTALDVRTGIARWSGPRPCSGRPPLLTTGAVIVGDGSDEAIALAAATGAELWRSTAARGEFIGDDGDIGVVLSRDPMEFVAFDLDSGAERWRAPADEMPIDRQRFAVDAGVVVKASEVEAASQPWHVGRLAALDLATGATLWSTEAGGDHEDRWQAIEASDGRLYGLHVNGDNTTVDALDLRSGAELWSFGPVGENYEDRPLIQVPGGVLLISNGLLWRFSDGEQGPTWQTLIEGGIEAMGADAERVYTSSTGRWRQIDY